MRKKWISVDERLPEPLVEVLVYTTAGKIYTDFTLFSDGKFIRRDVTHWMPLPEAPKMKGGAE